MEITSIRIKKTANGGNVLGTADIHLDNCLIIHGIKIIERNGKRILSFPNKKTKKYVMENGQYSETSSYVDVVHPSNQEFRSLLEKEIFKLYDNNDVKGENINE